MQERVKWTSLLRVGDECKYIYIYILDKKISVVVVINIIWLFHSFSFIYKIIMTMKYMVVLSGATDCVLANNR